MFLRSECDHWTHGILKGANIKSAFLNDDQDQFSAEAFLSTVAAAVICASSVSSSSCSPSTIPPNDLDYHSEKVSGRPVASTRHGNGTYGVMVDRLRCTCSYAEHEQPRERSKTRSHRHHQRIVESKRFNRSLDRIRLRRIGRIFVYSDCNHDFSFESHLAMFVILIL